MVFDELKEACPCLLDDVPSLPPTAFDEDGDFDFPSIIKELVGGFCLRLKIVLIGRRSEADFLNHGLLLVLLCLFGFLFPVELVFAIVDNLADRRMGHRGNAEKIHLGIIGLCLGDTDRHDPVVFALRSDKKNLFEVDTLVDEIRILLRTETIVRVITVKYKNYLR